MIHEPTGQFEPKQTGFMAAVDKLGNDMFMGEIFRGMWLSLEVRLFSCSCLAYSSACTVLFIVFICCVFCSWCQVFGDDDCRSHSSQSSWMFFCWGNAPVGEAG